MRGNAEEIQPRCSPVQMQGAAGERNCFVLRGNNSGDFACEIWYGDKL
jgi:hypothetical protein